MNITYAGIAAIAVLVIFFCIGCFRGLIREFVSLLGVVIIFVLVWFARPYVSDFLKNSTPVYSKIEKGCETFARSLGDEMGNVAISSMDQAAVLANSSIPAVFRKQLIENNNAQTYQRLGVTSFSDYVAAFFAEKIFAGLVLIITWLLAAIIVKAVEVLLSAIARLPVLRTVNRAAGGLLGLVKGLVVIFLIMLLLTVLCRTEFGKTGLDLIREDTALNWFYENTVERIL